MAGVIIAVGEYKEESVAGTSADRATGELPRELFWKTFKDPLTGGEFQALQVKSNAYSVRKRGVDFAPFYEGVNPLWYGVIVSPAGFAAEESVYKRSPRLLFRNREDVLAQIEGMPPPTHLMGERDLAQACASYSLALQLTEHLRLPQAEVASLALKASWLYRDWADEGYEPAAALYPALRQIALEKYMAAYEKEDISKLKLGSAGVGYLIAELLREQGSTMTACAGSAASRPTRASTRKSSDSPTTRCSSAASSAPAPRTRAPTSSPRASGPRSASSTSSTATRRSG